MKLDKAAFTLYRGVQNREDRKKVFEAFFGKINEFRATFGTQLYAEVKKDMFYVNGHANIKAPSSPRSTGATFLWRSTRAW